MTGTTATQNLPYPTSGDRVMDQWQHQKNLALALEDRFTSHAVDLARAGDVPLVVLEQLTSHDYPVSGAFAPGDELIQWDTVLADTAGMVDLATNPKLITITQNGYWRVSGYVANASGTLCAVGSGTMLVTVGSTGATGSTDTNAFHDGGQGAMAGFCSSEIRVSGNNATVFLSSSSTGTTCPTFITIGYARLWLYWVRDL